VSLDYTEKERFQFSFYFIRETTQLRRYAGESETVAWSINQLLLELCNFLNNLTQKSVNEKKQEE